MLPSGPPCLKRLINELIIQEKNGDEKKNGRRTGTRERPIRPIAPPGTPQAAPNGGNARVFDVNGF